jgi:zinc protease
VTRLVLPLLALLSIPFRGGEAQQPRIGPDTPLPVDPAVVTGELDNGLTYLIRQNGRPEARAELRLVVNVGSILEDDDQKGLAHLVEHMAFNGTANFEEQELVDYLESIGMEFGPSINASTSFDETIYMLRVPTDDPEVLATAFQILEDWAHQVTFTGEEIDKERGVVLEEWRLGLGARSRMLDQQLPVILKDSRYAERLPIGDPEVLRTFPHERLTDFYRTWYRPELMAVVAVGDFDPAVVEGLIRTHFSGLQADPEAPERPEFGVPGHAETLFTISTDPEATNSTVSILYKRPAQEEGTIGAYRRGLIESLYNGMLNNRLFEVGQRPDAPFAFAAAGQGALARGTEIYQLFAGVPEGGITRGMEAILTEAERVARHGFTATELERQKVEVLRSFERAFAERENQESRSLASEYIRHFLQNEPIPGIEAEYMLAQALLPSIGLEEVNGLASQWLADENRVVTADGPEKEGLVWPTEDELAEVFAAVEAAEIEPYEDTASDEPLVAQAPPPAEIVGESYHSDLNLTEWKLANGVRVLMKPTDFKDDEIVFRAFSPGGYSLSELEDHTSASSATTLVSQGGLGQFSLIDLQKVLAGKAVSVQPSIGAWSEGLSGGGSPQDLETLFQLIYLNFTAPRKDPEAFEAFRNRLEAVLANMSADPRTAFQDTVAVTMAQGHPRARPITSATLEEMDLNVAMEFYQDRFADASDFTFVFVGAMDLDVMRPLVQSYLGGLPSAGRSETWRDMGIRPPVGVVEKTVRRGVEPQSQTTIAFTGDFEWTRENRLGIRAMGAVLDIRLRELLREELGGTYGVGVNAGYDFFPEPSYDFRIGFGSDPERVEELTQAMFEEIRMLQEEGATEDEIQKVTEAERRSGETNRRENGWWVAQLAFAEQYGSDPADLLDSESVLATVTSESVREAARRYLRLDNFVRVTLMPVAAGQ